MRVVVVLVLVTTGKQSQLPGLALDGSLTKRKTEFQVSAQESALAPAQARRSPSLRVAPSSRAWPWPWWTHGNL